MRKPVFITSEEAAAVIADNVTVATIGTTLMSAAKAILKAIKRRFLETGSPRGLTLVHSCGQSDWGWGIQYFVHETMLSRIIGSHQGLQSRTVQLIADDKILAYCIPQGQFAQLYRSMARGEPGEITKVSLGTLIDPRIDGGKMSGIIMSVPDINKVATTGGEEYTCYKPIPLDYCITRGTYADKYGNLTTDEEAMQLEVSFVVMACKKFGGKVLAQAEYKIRTGSLHYKRVIVSGVLTDAAVICLNPEEDHRRTHSLCMGPACYGGTRAPVSSDGILPISLRKVIGCRALMELAPDDVLSVGTGIPNDIAGPIIAKGGMSEDVAIAVGSGVYGGISMGNINFGTARNQFALVRHDDQFDYHNGPGMDVTYMGAGKVDAGGNVNATRLRSKSTRASGFINTTTNAKHVVFCSSFTIRGLDCSFEGGRSHINQEGPLTKFVNRIKQIPYNDRIAREKGQKMHYVTERAVFEPRPEGLILTEIAPGIGIQTQVLDLMEFIPLISPDLKEMDTTIFMKGAPFGLRKYISSN